MQTILIGCDPELFCFNPSEKSFFSAHEFVPGTKKDPFRVSGGAIQVDGTALEINIDPVDNAEDFFGNIYKVISSAYSYLPDGTELQAKPTIHYPKAYYDALPRHVRTIGCEKDRDAWDSGILNDTPVLGAPGQVQGGGHIHIGWTQDQPIRNPIHRQMCIDLVRQMDYYVGLSSLFWDNDQDRRKGYGKPGAFRIKPYGVEYRSPSNRWISSKELCTKVFDLTMKAATRFRDGEKLFDQYGTAAKEIMELNDKEAAQEILNAIL